MRRGACFGLGPGGDDGRVCCPSRGASACRQNAWRSSSATTPMRTPALQKAVNDSEAISQELAKLGFDVVSAECRTPRHEPRSRRARKQDRERRHRAHLFRRTWLCRRRHQLPFAGRCACRRSWREGLIRDASLRRTASRTGCRRRGAATVILILDACRDNPFALPGKRSIGLTRGVSHENVSLREAATQFGYRIGDKGEFTDAGLLDALDQRTGARMPKTSFEMAKKILEQFWTSWIAFREYNGMLVYFTQLVTYRCASKRATAWAISRWTRSSSCRHAIRRTRTASPDGALYEGSAEDGLDAGAAHFMPMARSRRRGASTRRNSRGFSLFRLAR